MAVGGCGVRGPGGRERPGPRRSARFPGGGRPYRRDRRHIDRTLRRAAVGRSANISQPGIAGRGRTGQHHLGPPSLGGGEALGAGRGHRSAAADTVGARRRPNTGMAIPTSFIAHGDDADSGPLSGRTLLRPDGDLLRVGGLAPSALIRRGRPRGSALFSGASPGQAARSCADDRSPARAPLRPTQGHWPSGRFHHEPGRVHHRAPRCRGRSPPVDGDHVHCRRWQAPCVGRRSFAGWTARKTFAVGLNP